MNLLPLGLLSLLLALVLLWLASRRQHAAGLPGGRVVYSDTRQWGPLEEPFYDPILGLSGRPDYLVKKGAMRIPVEVKSGRVPAEPYDAHIFQLAAYCLLVEREFGVRPPYGLIHYGRRTFAIDYTADLEEALLDLLGDMRVADRKRQVARSHQQPARCSGCGYREDCDQRL